MPAEIVAFQSHPLTDVLSCHPELVEGLSKGRRTRSAKLIADWLDSLDVAQDTRTAYKRSAELFADWLAEHQPQALTPAVIREWRSSLDGSPNTVNLRLSAVRSFLDWAHAAGHLPLNPALGVKGAKRSGTTRRHLRNELTAGEVKAVLATCGDDCCGVRDRAIISLMAYTALRTVEVHRADVEDLVTRQGRLTLWVQGKGSQDKDDFVVLPTPAETALRRWLAVRPGPEKGPLFVSLSPRNYGERLSRPAIRATIKDRYKQGGVVGEGKTTHSLRHSAISQAIRGGATPTQARAMARHASLDTTLVYYHELGRLTEPAEDLISYD